jgi:hypothetical protein
VALPAARFAKYYRGRKLSKPRRSDSRARLIRVAVGRDYADVFRHHEGCIAGALKASAVCM